MLNSLTRNRLAALAACLLLTAAAVTLALLVRDGADTPASAAATRPAPATDKGPRFIDADVPGVLTFENGDCFHDPAINAALGEPRLNTIGCVGSENEVFSFTTLRERPFDEAAITREAVGGCTRAFRELWGEPAGNEDLLDVYPVMPTQRSWTEDGDRSAMCVVYSRKGSFTIDPISKGER